MRIRAVCAGLAASALALALTPASVALAAEAPARTSPMDGAPLPIEEEASFASEGLSAAAVRSVEQPTQRQIRDYVISNQVHPGHLTSFAEEPAIAAFKMGSLTQDARNNALKVLNLYRFVAGVPSNVALDASYSEMAQAGSLVMAANDELSHTPSRPSGMSDSLYNLGYSGTSQSNISWSQVNGVRGGKCSLSKTVVGYMSDAGSGPGCVNFDTVGHRRWCLNPAMGKTGFGAVDISAGSEACGTAEYSCMYAFDSSNSVSYDAVMWPAHNTPCELFDAGDPWSVSAKWIDGSTVVDVVRTRDSKCWHFGMDSSDGFFNVDMSLYGGSPAVVFWAEDMGAYQAGDTYKVVVKTSARTFSYTVSFFFVTHADNVVVDRYDERGNNAGVVSRLGMSVVNTHEEVVPRLVDSEFERFEGGQWFESRGIGRGSYTWESSSPSVVEVKATESMGRGARLDASMAGRATITVREASGVEGSFSVDVAGVPISSAELSEPIGSQIYQGSPLKPSFRLDVSRGGVSYLLSEGTDYDVSYSNNNAPGTGKIVVTGKGFYTGTKTIPFTIVAAPEAVGGSGQKWMKDSRGWWLKRADGTYPVSQWVLVDGSWYLFDGSGYMRTGWAQAGGVWYWLGSDGAMRTGWYMVGGEWNWSDSSGAWHPNRWVNSARGWWYSWAGGGYPSTADGWQKIDGSWYLFDGSGYMRTGWVQAGGAWYYLSPSGAMATGWLNLDGIWYWLGSDGAMRTGWYMVGGVWYHSSSSGSLSVSAWVDGVYWVGASGAMATNAQVDGGRYYVGPDGVWIP